ncbi:MAG: hypothetical protein OQL16_14425 [Gammaproteobacteria bacterium]|nr:hypothetical protein [Gammaproteobacteria bacterium]
MSRQRVNTLLGKGSFSSIRERALLLARFNACLQKQLPLSINTMVKLANIDTRHRAVIHVRGAEWSTQIRLQQGLIKAILRSCGAGDIKGVVVKNRPLKHMAEDSLKPERVQRPMSRSSREMVEAVAGGVSDKQLQQSLRRLARKKA